MKLKFLVILIFLIGLPLATSLDNVAQKDNSYDLRFTVAANGSIANVLSNITISDPNGLVIVAFQVMQKNTDSQDFNFTLPASNTSLVGFYDCTIFAFSTIADDTAFSCSFEVNPSGKEYIPEISAALIFSAILSLMFLSVFLIIVAGKVDLFPAKVFLIILAGIISILNLGFVSASFQEFFSISSPLSSSFGVVYISFVLMLTAASIFLLIYLIITGFQLYKIKRGFFVED